jgi:hypothetical protein
MEAVCFSRMLLYTEESTQDHNPEEQHHQAVKDVAQREGGI